MMQSTINLSRCSLLGLSECSLLNLLGGIPLGGPGTASILVLGDDITVAPSELGGELTYKSKGALILPASDVHYATWILYRERHTSMAHREHNVYLKFCRERGRLAAKYSTLAG